MPCILLLRTLGAEAAAAAPAAIHHFEIPATTLDDAVARLAAQTGISIGLSGRMPQLRTRRISGDFTVEMALAQMLYGSGLQAMPLGAGAYRLEARVAEASRKAIETAGDLGEVVVLAAKRQQAWRTIPIPMTVVSGEQLSFGGMPGGSRTALLLDAATSSTNLGPGRERQFIRGVADSAFLGPSQATVSVQFDDARATYDAPDPDLLLLDVAQVEILKGPQGPLYGTGALGGVFHIVPRRPDLQRFDWQSTLQLQQVRADDAGAGGSVMLNAPLLRDRLAVRAVAYARTEPGWIDNAGARADANDTRIRGVRLAVRSTLPADWILDVQGITQASHTSDSQYVGARHTLKRAGVLPEPHDNDFNMALLTGRGRLWGKDALLTASYVDHETSGALDASEAAAAWAEIGPLRYLDTRRFRLMNSEARLSSDAGARAAWLAGVSYLDARTDLTGSLRNAAGEQRDILHLAQHVGELALFGELSLRLPWSLRATGGLRLFTSLVENEGRVALLEKGSDADFYSATPSASLDWRSADERRFVFLRYARAVRPGGLNAGATELRRFAPDELSNVDLGTRLQTRDDALSMQSALFVTHWSHIQSDYLLQNGLIGTRNAGASLILGLESSLAWQVHPRWRLEAGATVQRARLDRAVLPEEDDERLPVVPRFRLRSALVHDRAFGAWQAQLRVDLNYVGSSRLSFEPALDRSMGDYLRADLGVQFQHGGLAWTLRLSNLFDSRADTFAYGNPFSVRTHAQFTPLAPRTVSLGLIYSPAR